MNERERKLALRAAGYRVTGADRELLTDWFAGVIGFSFSEEDCTALRKQANRRSLRRWLRGRRWGS
jgi:hypothetical protein